MESFNKNLQGLRVGLTRAMVADLIGILLLSILVLLPIFIWPHWGLFSDYDQILAWPQSCIDQFTEWLRTGRHGWPGFFKDLAPLPDGRWTPLFHVFDMLALWALGPHPLRFYVLQWGLLACALGAVYCVVYYVTNGKRLAGWLACVLALVSEPIYESFFTLDKVEPRLTFFSTALFGVFAWGLAAGGKERRGIGSCIALFLVEFFLAVLCIFSKETGVFIVVVSLLTLVVCMMQNERPARLIGDASLFFCATAAAYVLFKILGRYFTSDYVLKVKEANAGVGRYLAYDINWSLIHGNWNAYAGPMRETVLAAVLFVVWLGWNFLTGRIRQWDSRRIILFTFGMAGCVYATGMLLWRWAIPYFMLPAAIFLAAAGVALCAGEFQRDSGRMRWMSWGGLFLVLLFILAGTRVSRRWYSGMAILAQDRAKDELVQVLKKEAATHPRAVIALYDCEAAEIARSIEAYCFQNGLQGKIKICNFVEGPWTNLYNFHRFDGSAAEPPTEAEMEDALKLNVPFVIWKYAPQREIKRVWWDYPLQAGDLILIPVGSKKNGRVQARGVGIFVHEAEDAIGTRFAGLKLKTLDQPRARLLFSRSSIGWDVCEVVSTHEAIPGMAGLEISALGRKGPDQLKPGAIYLGKNWRNIDWDEFVPFRWGNNQSEIFLPGSRGAKEIWLDLEPNGNLTPGAPLPIRAVDDSGRVQAEWPLLARTRVRLLVPDYGGTDETIRLEVPDELKIAPNKICMRLYAIGGANSPNFYTAAQLDRLNPDLDITERPLGARSGVAENPSKYRVYLGYGWYPLESLPNKKHFRWVDTNAEIIVQGEKGLRLKLFLEIVPGNVETTPLELKLVDENGTMAGQTILTEPKIVEFNLPSANGQKQVYRLEAKGDYLKMANDPRHLRLRVFNVRCEIVSPRSRVPMNFTLDN